MTGCFKFLLPWTPPVTVGCHLGLWTETNPSPSQLFLSKCFSTATRSKAQASDLTVAAIVLQGSQICQAARGWHSSRFLGSFAKLLIAPLHHWESVPNERLLMDLLLEATALYTFRASLSHKIIPKAVSREEFWHAINKIQKMYKN